MKSDIDSEIISTLAVCHDEAAKIIEFRKNNPCVNNHEINARWHRAVGTVTEAMKSHAEFSDERSVYFLSRQILYGPWSQSANLLEQAVRLDEQAALDRYRNILRVRSANISVISEVYGLILREPVEFSNGVRLVPASQLIDTPQARALVLKGQALFGHEGPIFPAAAAMTFPNVAAELDSFAGHKKYLAAIETIRSTVTALTLSQINTPITGVSWIDFHDPDLIASGFGYGWQTATFDGRMPSHPVEIDPAAVEWTKKLLTLEQSVAAKCNVALARLNLARRRQTPGDQAIDGCIAIESLLSDGQPGDLTYKLKLRAARLLGNSYIERKEISQKVANFYRLRGKVVHGQSTGASNEDRQAAKDGLDLTLAALHKIVLNGRIPDLPALELGPADENGEP